MEPVIIISTKENKKKILRENSRNKHLYNLKFYTFKELKKKLFFDYDLTTILFIVKKYHVTIPIAKIYLENLYFLKDLDHEKVKFLNELKKELDKKSLLIYEKAFSSFIKNKKIIVYDYPILSKEQKLILNEIKANIEYQNIAKAYEPTIFEAKSIDEEVEFVINKIAELLIKNVSLTNIKIIASSDYNNLLTRYLSIFKIPFNNQPNHSFYSTLIAKDFLKNYNNYSLEENIMHLSEKYQNVNELINIINRSVKIEDKQLRKEFIIEDLKQAKVKEQSFLEALEITNLNTSFSDDDYVFLLGFNVNSYPKIKKDTDFLPDAIKMKLGLDTTTDYNTYEVSSIINKIHSIKNLIITYKLKDYSGTCYPSVLLNKFTNEIKPVILDATISYSKLYSEIKYAKALDNLSKFNIISKDLALYQNNLDIPYSKYNNNFKGILPEYISKKLNNELTLSYTNLEMYQECAFRYYITKILHLDIFLENFKTILGSIMHHILELGLIKDIDIPLEMIKFIKEKDYDLNAKEFFYLEEFGKELTNILSIIKKQQTHSQLNNYLFETEVFVYKDKDDFKITFKGNIDKVMYKAIDNNEVLAVVDYKTGNTNITLKNLDYGLNIQLPIYLYLLKKSDRFANSKIAGFYIQKISTQKEAIQFKKSHQELIENRLRLQGYTNSDEYLMKLIDDDYKSGNILANVEFKKDGTLSSKSKVLTNKEMDDIIIKVDEIIEEVITNILNANFAINPKIIDNKNISCTYCHFRDLCYKQKKNEVILGGESHEMDQRAATSNC